MKKQRVVVAMSGGVDSSVAAALLKQQGYEVIGVTMCFSLGAKPVESQRSKPSCCGLSGIEDARRVAYKLGIKHYVLNMARILQEKVIHDFCSEYLNGRTPNPCVRCNQFIKFDALLKKAKSMKADFLATGHYARVVEIGSPKSKIRRYLLKKAKDLHKDQSYFLYRLNQKQLKSALFPLGNYSKTEVRKLAKEFALPVADKPASQEICFLPEVNYRGFLRTQAKLEIKPGPLLDLEGNILGYHKGVPFYTIGQREGLGIAKGYPLYVTKIDPKNNRITVGKREDVLKREFLLKHVHFILKPIKKKIAVRVRIRYNHTEAPAEISPFGKTIKVRFKKPQFAITPGQSAVFYERDKVLGGGLIDEVLR
jgi:tRNA-specific 2-thiouridylase